MIHDQAAREKSFCGLILTYRAYFVYQEQFFIILMFRTCNFFFHKEGGGFKAMLFAIGRRIIYANREIFALNITNSPCLISQKKQGERRKTMIFYDQKSVTLNEIYDCIFCGILSLVEFVGITLFIRFYHVWSQLINKKLLM